MASLPRLRKIFSTQLIAGIFIGALLTTGVGAAVRGSAIFKDIRKGAFYDDAVGEMNGLGIIKGFEDGTFHPNDPVTRGQLAVLFKRLRDDIKGIAPESSVSSSTPASVSSSSVSSSSVRSSSSSATSSVAASPNGAFRFATPAFSVTEVAGTAKLTVLRTGGARGAVTVDYATQAGTAADGDFVMNTGTLSFADGETSKLVTITIKDDTVAEPAETFTVTLAHPTGGAVLGSPLTLVITVIDNDGASSSPAAGSTTSASATNANGLLGFSALTYGFPENGGAVNVAVNRASGSAGAVAVNFATSDGTARSGIDYAATQGTLSFAAGETSKTIPVTLFDNANLDGSKTFTLTLSSPTGGAAMGNPARVTATIIDNETLAAATGSLKFSDATYNAYAADGMAKITVQRVGGSQGTVSVNYTTSDGTGIAGTDYAAAAATLTFAPGEMSKSFMVTLIKRTPSLGERVINLALSNPTGGASFGTITNAVLKSN